jgi:hypothetical protein
MPSRPTLSTFRAQWPSEAMGICQADPQVATYCNDSQERLLIDPLAPDEGWWGSSVTMNLSATVSNATAYVVTPREIARLVVTAVCQHPVHIRNRFYEYLKWGAGLQPKSCQGIGCGSTFQAYERDNVVTFAPLLPTPQTIRVYPTDSRDIGLRVLLQGKDQNGQVILTTDPGTGTSAPGEYLSIASPFVDSANTYSAISGIQKDQTYGPLQFFQVDPTTGAEAVLSTMDANESVANYRRYMVNGIPNINLCCTGAGQPVMVEAQGRLDFNPVMNETDYLTIQCVPALIEEAQSIRYSRMDAGANQSNIHHARAIALLNGQLDLYEGKVSAAIRMPIFGSNRMRRQPV